MSNFAVSHQMFGQAVIALANPSSVVYSELRNSSVENIKLIKEEISGKEVSEMKKTVVSLGAIKTMLNLIKDSHDPLVHCKESIQSTGVSEQEMEKHQDLFQVSDESQDDSESDEWGKFDGD